MVIQKYAKSFYFRPAISIGLSVFVAVFVNDYFSYSKEYWVVLSAFLVSQTSRGTPVRQGMILFLIIIAAIISSSFLTAMVNQEYIIYVVLSIIFVASSYAAFLGRPQANTTFLFIIFFSIVMLIATLSPVHSSEYMQNRVLDSLMGALIGIISGIVILPRKINEEFIKGIIPVMESLMDYSQKMKDCILRDGVTDESITQKKIEVENALQSQQGMYPEWVYEVGFNRGLRSGFRYFLVNLERITEILFSMEYILYQEIELSLLQALSAEIESVMTKNHELFRILIGYFADNELNDFKSDFTSDVTGLEKSLQRMMPPSLELLELSPSYLLITALVRDLRDLRGLLLQLVMTLQTPVSNMSRVD